MSDAPRGLLTQEEASSLVGIGFDFVVAQPLRRFVDGELVLRVIDAAVASPVVDRVIREHVAKIVERQEARVHTSGEPVSHWIQPDAAKVVRQLLGTPLSLDPALVRPVIDQPAVRRLIRSITEETITRFLQNIGQGGGVLGTFGRGAVGIASSMGKAFMGSGNGTASRTVSAFIDASMAQILAHIVDQLAQPETAREMGQLLQVAFDTIREQKVALIVDQAKPYPRAPLYDVLPKWAAYVVALPQFRDAVAAEIATALELEGDKTVAALLTESGTLELVRGEAVRIAAPLLREFTGSPALIGWLLGRAGAAAGTAGG